MLFRGKAWWQPCGTPLDMQKGSELTCPHLRVTLVVPEHQCTLAGAGALKVCFGPVTVDLGVQSREFVWYVVCTCLDPLAAGDAQSRA